MRKLAFLFLLLFLGSFAFLAARYLPNQLETFDIKSAEVKAAKPYPIYPKKEEFVVKEEIKREEDPELKGIQEEEGLLGEEEELNPEDEERDYALAQSFLAQGKNKELLYLIEKRKGIDYRTEKGRPWLDLLLEYAVKNKDYTQLLVIYRYDPSIFKSKEDASLLLGKALIDSGRDPLYWALRKEWEKREGKGALWLALDADAYLFQGKRDEAIEVLRSKEFEGKEDVQRLYRLALLHIAENPKKAFEWLNKAHLLDPENGEVLSYRGKVLEMAGRDDLAFKDYYLAWTLNPLNPKTVLQLSDFYIRQKDFLRALEILSANLDKTEDDALLIKALFLGKVIKPIKPIKKLESKTFEPTPYAVYLANLSPWEFWNEFYYDRIPTGKRVEGDQSLFWLQLLHALKRGEKEEALTLLQHNVFSNQSWNPELESALKEILAFQLYGSFSLKERDIPLSKLESKAREALLQGKGERFIERINSYAIKAEEDPYHHIAENDKELISGNLAYVVLLLETNWGEGALGIFNENEGKSLPKWLAISLTKAYEESRGSKKAREFAEGQRESPELNLLIAELLIKEGNLDAGLQKLSLIRNPSEDVAEEAAWLRALSFMERGEYARARTEIQLNSRLGTSLRGKELFAKAALLEGKDDLAEDIYSEIGGESYEAKSFLARCHFKNRNIPLAKKLTLELLEKNPNSQVLKKNMGLIEKFERENPSL